MTSELWLTEIRMNPRNRDVGKDLRSITQLHRTVMSLFPDTGADHARQSYGVLHRLDSTASGPVLLVQSAQAPALAGIPGDYGHARYTPLAPLLDRLAVGSTVRYRILVNATKRFANGERKGKRVALGLPATRDWWTKRAAEAGMVLVGDSTFVCESLVGRETDDGRITIRPWRIDGVARIEDPAALRKSVETGIGRGRAYGCGLLSLSITQQGQDR